MSNDYFQLQIFSDTFALVDEIAERFSKVVFATLENKDSVHIALEGGSVSELTLNRLATLEAIPWDKLHFWWSDERFVPAGSSDRNYEQARRCLFAKVPVPPQNLHPIAACDEVENIEEAVSAYLAQLQHWADDEPILAFDICFLGMGPDGHTASLFPNREQVNNQQDYVLAVLDAPKPPPERVTLAYPAINNSLRVWIEVAGSPKAMPLKLTLEGIDPFEVPLAGVQGKLETIVFADESATSLVSE